MYWRYEEKFDLVSTAITCVPENWKKNWGGGMRQMDGFTPSVAILLLQVDEAKRGEGGKQGVPLSGVHCRRREHCGLNRHKSICIPVATTSMALSLHNSCLVTQEIASGSQKFSDTFKRDHHCLLFGATRVQSTFSCPF
jgi:hypothetical protein